MFVYYEEEDVECGGPLVIGQTYVSPDVTLQATTGRALSCVPHNKQHCSIANKAVDMSTSFVIPDFTLAMSQSSL